MLRKHLPEMPAAVFGISRTVSYHHAIMHNITSREYNAALLVANCGTGMSRYLSNRGLVEVKEHF